MQLKVREAIAQDAQAIAGLLGVLMEEHDLTPPSMEVLVQAVQHVLRLPDTWYFVAVDDDIVGMLQLSQRYSTWAASSYGYIEDFCVTRPLRGKGVGTQLLAHVANVAQSKGWARLDLDVSISLPDTIRFYERYGYHSTSSMLYRKYLPSG